VIDEIDEIDELDEIDEIDELDVITCQGDLVHDLLQRSPQRDLA
jgi:hypothetical protein